MSANCFVFDNPLSSYSHRGTTCVRIHDLDRDERDSIRDPRTLRTQQDQTSENNSKTKRKMILQTSSAQPCSDHMGIGTTVALVVHGCGAFCCPVPARGCHAGGARELVVGIRRCVKGRGSAKAPLSCGRRSPQGLCSLKEGFRTSAVKVPVLGVIKCGVMYDITRRGASVFGRSADNPHRDLGHACAWGHCATVRSDKSVQLCMRSVRGTCAVYKVTPLQSHSCATRIKFSREDPGKKDRAPEMPSPIGRSNSVRSPSVVTNRGTKRKP